MILDSCANGGSTPIFLTVKEKRCRLIITISTDTCEISSKVPGRFKLITQLFIIAERGFTSISQLSIFAWHKHNSFFVWEMLSKCAIYTDLNAVLLFGY